MPTGLFDCSGLMMCVRGDDGKFHPVDLSQTVTLSPDPDDEWEYEQITAQDFSFTITAHLPKQEIKRIRKHLKRSENRYSRRCRRIARAKEKERRRRLKEGNRDA